jgi:cytoskeletal protein RodZ
VSVGDALSSARLDRGLSVDDVSAATRIRGTLVRAIEADDFTPCGGAVYARGHIRSIARVVGVDPEPLIAEFDRASGVEQPVAAPVVVSPQPTDREIVARSERHGPNWFAAMAVALVVICALAAISLVATHSGSTKGHHPSAPVQAAPRRTPATSPPPSSVAQIPAEQASMLIRTTNGATWMQVTSKSGSVLFRGLLSAGQRKLFTNKHGLLFVIGNAPAVDLVVNGHDIGSPHSAGNVSRGRVIPGADTIQLT